MFVYQRVSNCFPYEDDQDGNFRGKILVSKPSMGKITRGYPQKKPWPLCIQSVGISQRDQPWQRQPQISQDLHQKRGVDRPELPRLGR